MKSIMAIAIMSFILLSCKSLTYKDPNFYTCVITVTEVKLEGRVKDGKVIDTGGPGVDGPEDLFRVKFDMVFDNPDDISIKPENYPKETLTRREFIEKANIVVGGRYRSEKVSVNNGEKKISVNPSFENFKKID